MLTLGPLTFTVWRYLATGALLRYGEVVRIAPDELSFVNPDALRDIYGHGAKGTQGRVPPKAFSRYPEVVYISMLNEPSDAEHARIRRIFSPAFSERALTEQEPVFVKYADQLVHVLQKKSKEEQHGAVDFVQMFNFTTFDIMADMTFGEPLHMLDNAEYTPWVSMIFGYVKVATCAGILKTYYPRVFGLIEILLGNKMQQTRKNHMQHTVTRVTKRLTQGRQTEGVDLWTYVLSQQAKGKKGLSRGSMDANASLFMIAGTETTATTLSGLVYMLMRDPATMNKLTAEIRESFASSSDISMERLARLPYLNACIKEAMRIYPSVPVGLPHLTPVEGSTICGQFVPPGVIVSASHLFMYTSPNNFKDPLRFIPERWTGDERFESDKRAAVNPFSVGTRDCLGKNMATHEMRLILAKVLWSFDLELYNQHNDWLDQKLFLTWEKMPLMVKLNVAER
ncbi:hypothetical protein E8E12_007001 [Didymella heteroderae]|uniref:Cytochrome P450 n=1 Tax=Didymella heteroderae TaxID=1769908 RepID=A0A9P5C5M6_9PLEO|nr:hypothetical protein E8E12_007001 [Didymella heteroderae]